ncbi:type II toxin-antitoxin system RelE/ParE family toxin [Flavobacterium sp.]|uniref:type II toxin-antitoxin system RelE/ParE family toxin n=1 Tax=Flavobacterium sp. TaxID=239 RepID=UPI0035B246CB
MSYQIRFIKQAIFDIEEAVLWYEEQREGLSFDFELCLDVGLAEISRDPNNFQKRYKEVRVRFIPRFPYGIHYLIKSHEVIVIAVFQTSRSPKNWKKRL